jgi:hypothetical protein
MKPGRGDFAYGRKKGLCTAKNWGVDGASATSSHVHSLETPPTQTSHLVRASGGGQPVTGACADRGGCDEGRTGVERHLHRRRGRGTFGGKPGHDTGGFDGARCASGQGERHGHHCHNDELASHGPKANRLTDTGPSRTGLEALPYSTALVWQAPRRPTLTGSARARLPQAAQRRTCRWQGRVVLSL